MELIINVNFANDVIIKLGLYILGGTKNGKNSINN
jgi:hypothetical protein